MQGQGETMKRTILIFGVLLLSIAFVFAQESHDAEIDEGKLIVESKTSCDKLSNEQLESIGDYYMEQMHPGEAHEIMDNMMGGEGSESLKQVHINMAKRLYCNDNNYVGYGMMSQGGMMQMGNMMGGMMGNSPMGYGSGFGSYGYWNIFWILIFAVIIFLIVWLVYKFVIKKTADENPLDILKKRYAKGEITKKQFEEMKKEIE